MRKRKKGRKLSRESSQRNALKWSLARALFLHERIQTTQAKAKELSPFAEKLITRAKKKDIASRRILARSLSNEVVKKLVDDIAKRYSQRHGGCVRIIKMGPRPGDGSKMAIIELVK